MPRVQGNVIHAWAIAALAPILAYEHTIICIYIYKYNTYLCVCVCVNMVKYTKNISVCTYLSIYMHYVYIYMYILYTCMYMIYRMYVCMHACMYVCIYLYTCIYIYTYIYNVCMYIDVRKKEYGTYSACISI